MEEAVNDEHVGAETIRHEGTLMTTVFMSLAGSRRGTITVGVKMHTAAVSSSSIPNPIAISDVYVEEEA